MHGAAGILRLQAERIQPPQHGEYVAAPVDRIAGNHQVLAAMAPVAIDVRDLERSEGCIEETDIALDIAQDQRVLRCLEYGAGYGRGTRTGKCRRWSAQSIDSSALLPASCCTLSSRYQVAGPAAVRFSPDDRVVEETGQLHLVSGVLIRMDAGACETERDQKTLMDTRFREFGTRIG